MIRARVYSIVRLTFVFQTVSSCDRQQTAVPRLFLLASMFSRVSFYIHEEQMWIKDLNNRSQELLRLTDYCEMKKAFLALKKNNYYSYFIFITQNP